MKNVIVYNQLGTKHHGASRWDMEGLFRYLRAQIDNSLRLGWKADDIVVGTNFEFEYRGVVAHRLTNVCEWSGFHNFWYGALDLLDQGVIDNHHFWLHDHDSWQLSPLEFPGFKGDVAGIEYGGTTEWNCGSVYFNPGCKETLQYIVDTLEHNKEVDISSDEVIIGFLRRYAPNRDRFVSINSRWNIGLTHSEYRLGGATKPYQVLSFKPDEVGIYTRLNQKNLLYLIDPEFQTILDKHFKNESN